MEELVGRDGDFTCEVTVEAGDNALELALAAAAWRKDGTKALPDQMGDFLRRAFRHGDRPIKVTISGKRAATAKSKLSLTMTISFEIQPARKKPVEAAPPAEEVEKAPRKEPAHGDPHGGRHGDGPAESGDDHGEADAKPSMPPVRLGIMPTYGEQDGEGYEISGVTPGGPADQAGMKDTDRIYKIGDHLIKDVYTYMDALRQYKPGDEIPVIVLRDGKQVKLTIKAAAPKSKEAA